MIWELIQQYQIGQAQWAAQEAKSGVRDTQSEHRHLSHRIQTLEESVDRLSLATIALAEILRDRLGVAQSEIDAKIQEIDLRDGLLDGRLRTPTNDCSHCHHTNAGNRRKCLYCGEPRGANEKPPGCIGATDEQKDEP